MATPPDSPVEEVMFELEPSRAPKHRPVALEDLCRQTKFTRQEIRVMYRGFKQECPDGVVQEDAFKDIYAKFFPHGNSSLYAHYVFKAFDVNCNGAITFRDLLVTLSTLLRGSIYEKLRWTFKLYDVNGDGCITRSELAEIVVAIHELMGRRASQRALRRSGADAQAQMEDDRKCRDQVDRVFRKLDLNQDGVITIEEFIESCLKDEIITQSMAMFDTSLWSEDASPMVVPASLVAHLGDLTLSDSEADAECRLGLVGRGLFQVHAPPRTASATASRVSTGAHAGTSGPGPPPPLPPLPSQAVAGPQWTPMAVLAADTAWAQDAAWPDEDDFGNADATSKRNSKETDV